MRRLLLLSCCTLLAGTAPAVAVEHASVSMPAAASVSGSRAADWPTVGGDLANSRYSGLSQIDISNVKTLGGRLGKRSRRPEPHATGGGGWRDVHQ